METEEITTDKVCNVAVGLRHMGTGQKRGCMNTRELVLDMLMEITEGTEYSHIILKNVLDKYNYLSGTEKSFINRLCSGTLERRIQIDYIVDLFSSIKAAKMKPVIRNILRMGVYQILFMESVPDSAACNEAVKLAEKKKFFQLKGFVNAVLRNIARNADHIEYPDRKKDLAKFLSVTYSMPEWLVLKWLALYGDVTAEKIVAGLLEEHPLTIRIEETISEEEKKKLLAEIREAGIEALQHPFLSYAYMLKDVEGVLSIPGFTEGKCTVQDVSSMLVGEAAGIRGNENILDVCAAPGGKAIHAAAKLRGTGHVEARDVSQAKLCRILENIERMGYHNIEAVLADATVLDSAKKQSADIVLADLPCSGLGVIGRKADIKYRVTEEALKSLTALQKEILTVVQDYVKPGGVLIYSTCTINNEENEDMIKWFTNHFPFSLDSLDSFLPESLQGETTGMGYLQLLPGIHGTDGFFLARLKRD